MVTCTRSLHCRRDFSLRRQKVPHYFLQLTFGLAVLIFGLLLPQSASANCGNIIGPEDLFSSWLSIETTPITDCSNPFNALRDAPPVTLIFGGQVLVDGDVITIPSEGTFNYNYYYTGYSIGQGSEVALYRHEGQNFNYINLDYSEPEENDYRLFAEQFFAPGVDIEPYIQLALGNELEDEEAIDWEQNFQFQKYVYNEYVSVLPVLLPGTYTLLSQDYELIMVRENSWWQNLRNILFPTAYAQYESPVYPIYAVTFTLAEAVEEPVGASNILFIPGIMGSRLYENSGECSLFGAVEERERWYSRSTCDQLRLKTNYLGQSLNDIYTYARESAIVDEITFPGVPDPNIYESLLSDLQTWESEGIISDYGVLPYDWRLRFDDLIKMKRDETTNKVTLDSSAPLNQTYLYETLSRLAQSSKSGKVTVVAHSNGGLLIKYFLHHLSLTDDPLASKIDNLILVAVPQVGTPESLIGVLHGVELGAGGIVMDSQTSRTLLKSAPFGFHLLPARDYFDDTGIRVLTPVMIFEPGLITDYWLSSFGPSIQTFNGMRNFLVEESGRKVPEEDDLSTPAMINSSAFNYINLIELALTNWQPNAGTKVYQIAGVGLDTPSGLTYFTDVKCTARSFFICTTYEKQLGYRINSVLDGDATVVSTSALVMGENDQVERWWLNLLAYNKINIDRSHRDIIEVEDIRNFVINTVKASTTQSYTYLTKDPPTFSEGQRLIFQLHSPLDMFVVLDDGTLVGSSTDIVRNVHYRRFGEVQFISLPATENNFNLRLQGLKTGSFTLDIEKYTTDSLIERITYSAIPSSTSTRVLLPIVSAEAVTPDTELLIDYDGNGEVDIRYNEEGEVIEEVDVVSYEDLFSSINSLDLNKSRKKVLITLAEVAEKFNLRTTQKKNFKSLEKVALGILQHKVNQYKKQRWITADQENEISDIIKSLIENK